MVTAQFHTEARRRETNRPRRFVFLLLDRFTMLSFAGAIEPLRIANRVTGRTIYEWHLVGEGGTTATCSNGAAFQLDMGWVSWTGTTRCWFAAASTCRRPRPSR